MWHKYIFIFFWVKWVCGKNSFTMVVDTTNSMVDEVDILKNNIDSLLKAMNNRNFDNYILIPFLHSDPGPPLISQSPQGLSDIISAIEVSGRHDCRENSLSAIHEALEVSKERSMIFVFTDAEAQDSDKLYSIQNLCENRQSQVIIFQSGKCIEDPMIATENVYKKIASSCGGSYFFFYLNNLRQAFKYMNEMTKVHWSQVNTHKEFYGSNHYSFFIDEYTTDLLIAISGVNPTITIKNNFGEKVTIDEIIETCFMKVIRVGNVALGDYTADISCEGSTLVTFYRKKEVKFRYGFSPLQPNSLRETTLLPIPGILNYLLICLPIKNLDLISIHLQISDEKDHIPVDHRLIDENRKLYAATILIEPMKTFKVLLKCKDGNNQEISGSTKQMKPQQLVSESEWIAPKAEILDVDPLIDFTSSYSLACKVKSYPKPEIWWENNMEERLQSESALLEIPNVYISYVKIENATKNETIICKCKNTEGEDTVSTNIYVNRTFTFEVLRTPSDLTIEYGSDGKLFCEANAYPEAEIKWNHNDTVIESSEEIEIIPDEQMLLIKNMNLDKTGTYSCVISNEIETRTFTASVYISGLGNKTTSANSANRFAIFRDFLKPGEQTEQQCTIIKGIPAPDVSWKFKSRYDNIDLSDVPDGVRIDGGTLKIDSAELLHGGFYICEASNILGMDTREVAIKIQYPPKIRNGDELKVVKYGDTVELPCDVDAVPRAIVHWDLYQDDVIIPLDARHITDDRNTHRFTATSNDSGMYVCMAQNTVGSATRTVTINVLVAPYIEALAWKSLTARTGSTVLLSCKVTAGNPVPSTRWVFIAPNLNTTVLLRGRSAGKLDLVLKSITKRHEGSYQCIADNDVAVDTVKLSLKVI